MVNEQIILYTYTYSGIHNDNIILLVLLQFGVGSYVCNILCLQSQLLSAYIIYYSVQRDWRAVSPRWVRVGLEYNCIICCYTQNNKLGFVLRFNENGEWPTGNFPLTTRS